MKLTLKILLLLVVASFAFAEDVTIDQSIDIAIQNSPNVKVFREQVSQAKDTIGLANAYLNPTLSGSAQYTREDERKRDGVGTLPKETSSAGVSVKMPIDIGGQFHIVISGAKSMYKSSEFALNNGLFDIVKTVKTNYLMCLLYRENINTAQSALELSQSYLDKVKKEVEAGTKAKFDITRQEYDVAERKTKLINAQNNYDQMINVFNMSLGLENNFLSPVSLENLNVANVSDINGDLINLAFENRSDLKQAIQDLETAKLSLINQKKTNNPSLNIVGNYEYLILNKAGYDNRNNWTAGVNLSVPIFDGGIQNANAKIYQSKVDAQQSVVDSKRQSIINGVLNSKLSALSNQSQIEQCESAVVLAKEAYDIAKLRYEQNLGTYLDVSDALNSLVAAQDALASSKYNYAMSMVSLEREIGTTLKVNDYTQAIINDVNAKKVKKGETDEK